MSANGKVANCSQCGKLIFVGVDGVYTEDGKKCLCDEHAGVARHKNGMILFDGTAELEYYEP